jgi:hypothetical protein
MLSTNPVVVLILFVLMTVSVLLCFQSSVFCVVMMVAERRREERQREPIVHHYCIVDAAQDDEPCSICLEPMKTTSAQLHCKHTFHEACLQQWNTQNCPLCRASTKEHTLA